MRLPPARLAIGAAFALTLTGAAVVAVAQTPPPAPPPGAPGMERHLIIRGDGPAHVGGGDRMYRRSPEDRTERLRTLLQLTPNQEGALKTFMAATAPPEPSAFMQPMKDDKTPPPNAPLGAVERADRAAAMAGKIAAEAKARADATRAFYAALTPSQRKVFDTTPGGGPMIMRIHDMHGPGRPPMPPMPPPPPGA